MEQIIDTQLKYSISNIGIGNNPKNINDTSLM